MAVAWPATRRKLWCIVIVDDGLLVYAQGSAIQTGQTSHPSLCGSPILGTPAYAFALTHRGQVAEDRNEPDMLPAANEDRLGLARPRVGSILL
jgi:hypothetical protein